MCGANPLKSDLWSYSDNHPGQGSSTVPRIQYVASVFSSMYGATPLNSDLWSYSDNHPGQGETQYVASVFLCVVQPLNSDLWSYSGRDSGDSYLDRVGIPTIDPHTGRTFVKRLHEPNQKKTQRLFGENKETLSNSIFPLFASGYVASIFSSVWCKPSEF